MLVTDPELGNSALRFSGAAALVVFICALTIDWTRTRPLARVAVVLLGAVLGATLAWTFLDGGSLRDQGAERRMLELRTTELDAQALAPNSPLACLDGVAGDTVEAACEKALFASPAAVASASSYVAARVALLADIVSYGKHGGRNLDDLLRPLRRSIEADRFGFVAHMLAVRDGCTRDHCPTLALLSDGGRVQTNLSAQTLDRYLDRYASAWAQQTDVPEAASTPPAATASAAPGPAPQKKVLIDADFPSAASIPAVSIMNPEPKTLPPSVAAAANAHPPVPAPARQIRKQAATSPGPTLASPGGSSPAPVDPVWMPGAGQNAPQPQQPAPPQATAGAAPHAQ